MITTTLKRLREEGACIEGYNKLVCALSGEKFDADRESYIRFAHEEPIPLTFILQSNGIDDALWALRVSNASDRDCRLFAVACARSVEHLTPDPRVKACNDVSERFANGEATEKERAAALDAAGDAAGDAAWAATWAARAATWAARAAARDAAWAAARAAAWATRAATWAAQSRLFVEMCEGRAPWQIASAKQ